MKTRHRRIAALAVVALAGGLVAAAVAPRSAQPRPAGACGARTKPPRTYRHVIWIWMENHAAGQIVGSKDAPYVNSLAAACGLATNYTAITHPSLPNYVAATSGGTQGVADDGPPAAHPLAAKSLFEQARTAGSYEESMPSNCAPTDAYPYVVKHNPEAYYMRIRAACRAHDVPLGTPAAGAFRTGLAYGLPAFSFVTPNICSDMHDCSVQTGDAWLRTWVPKILASRGYRAGNTVLFVTWDEDDSASPANKVATLVVSPFTRPGTRSARPFTHYSLLRTTEQLLGIRTYLGGAATAPGMRSAFGL